MSVIKDRYVTREKLGKFSLPSDCERPYKRSPENIRYNPVTKYRPDPSINPLSPAKKSEWCPSQVFVLIESVWAAMVIAGTIKMSILLFYFKAITISPGRHKKLISIVMATDTMLCKN